MPRRYGCRLLQWLRARLVRANNDWETGELKSSENLIWIDLEMTGLDPDSDLIIEIATIVTDKHLLVLEEGPVAAIHQDDSVLDSMDEWNTDQHGISGLTARVRVSRIDEARAEQTDSGVPAPIPGPSCFTHVR